MSFHFVTVTSSVWRYDRPVETNSSCALVELSGVCFWCSLYGFKVHPLAYELQFQAAANFKTRPTTHSTTSVSYANSKRWTASVLINYWCIECLLHWSPCSYCSTKVNPLKCSGISWLHLKLIIAIHVQPTFLISDIQALWCSGWASECPNVSRLDLDGKVQPVDTSALKQLNFQVLHLEMQSCIISEVLRSLMASYVMSMFKGQCA